MNRLLCGLLGLSLMACGPSGPRRPHPPAQPDAQGCITVEVDAEAVRERMLRFLAEDFSDLEKEGIRVRLVIDPEMHEHIPTAYAAYLPRERGDHVDGRIIFPTRHRLLPEDTTLRESVIYHELIHARQDVQARRHPWMDAYFRAEIPYVGPRELGSELEATYEEALFQETQYGEIHGNTMRRFFEYARIIRVSPAYAESPRIRARVGELRADMERRTGVDADTLGQQEYPCIRG